jgi:hypothetical protein
VLIVARARSLGVPFFHDPGFRLLLLSWLPTLSLGPCCFIFELGSWFFLFILDFGFGDFCSLFATFLRCTRQVYGLTIYDWVAYVVRVDSVVVLCWACIHTELDYGFHFERASTLQLQIPMLTFHSTRSRRRSSALMQCRSQETGSPGGHCWSFVDCVTLLRKT